MRREVFVGILALLFVLVGCAPQVETEDPNAPYKQSLLSAFQGDIASLGEIPRYRIAVSLDVDALILTGRQQVRYTNNESNKLGKIYFRLYPNQPQFGSQMEVQKSQD